MAHPGDASTVEETTEYSGVAVPPAVRKIAALVSLHHANQRPFQQRGSFQVFLLKM